MKLVGDLNELSGQEPTAEWNASTETYILTDWLIWTLQFKSRSARLNTVSLLNFNFKVTDALLVPEQKTVSTTTTTTTTIDIAAAIATAATATVAAVECYYYYYYYYYYNNTAAAAATAAAVSAATATTAIATAAIPSTTSTCSHLHNKFTTGPYVY